MGKRGPQPQHPDLKRLEGNPGKKALRPVVRAEGPVGDPPEHLDDDAKGAWWEMVGSLPVGFYSVADRNVLSMFCEACSLHKKAVLALRAEGCVVIAQSGAPYQNPWVSIQNKQATLIATLGDRLGANPSARIGMKVEKDERPSRFGTLLELKKSSPSSANSQSRAA